MRTRDLPLAEGIALFAVTGYVGAMAWSMRASTTTSGGLGGRHPSSCCSASRCSAGRPDERWSARLRAALWVVAFSLLSTVPRYLMAFVLYGGMADAGVCRQRRAHCAPDLPGRLHRRRRTRRRHRLCEDPHRRRVHLHREDHSSAASWFSRASRSGGRSSSTGPSDRAAAESTRGTTAACVFFLPSMLFWPSSIGKEAWMTLCLGLGTLGVARLYVRARFGFLPLALGLAGAAMVRPHIAVMLLAGHVRSATCFARRVRGRHRAQSRREGTGLVVLLVGVAVVAVEQAATFFEVDDVSSDSVDQVLGSTQERTDQGGSSFTGRARPPTRCSSRRPSVQVLLRPFPWEAHNAQAVLASAEGLFLLYLGWVRRRQPTLPASSAQGPSFPPVLHGLLRAVRRGVLDVRQLRPDRP